MKQLVHESFPYCASFRFDNPQFLEIVVECLHMHRSACASHEDYQFNFPSCTLSLCLSCYFFEAFDQDIVLGSCTRLPAFSLILSLI
jgi:hypothetical protein